MAATLILKTTHKEKHTYAHTDSTVLSCPQLPFALCDFSITSPLLLLSQPTLSRSADLLNHNYKLYLLDSVRNKYQYHLVR